MVWVSLSVHHNFCIAVMVMSTFGVPIIMSFFLSWGRRHVSVLKRGIPLVLITRHFSQIEVLALCSISLTQYCVFYMNIIKFTPCSLVDPTDNSNHVQIDYEFFTHEFGKYFVVGTNLMIQVKNNKNSAYLNAPFSQQRRSLCIQLRKKSREAQPITSRDRKIGTPPRIIIMTFFPRILTSHSIMTMRNTIWVAVAVTFCIAVARNSLFRTMTERISLLNSCKMKPGCVL